MRPLWATLLLAAGRGRAALVVASTALATGLLLVGASIARLTGGMGGYFQYSAEVDAQGLIGPITDPGTRGGAVLGVVLMTVPLLLLLDQAVRLGSSARDRRYAALAVAGATRADRRRWGAVEVGAPAATGAVLGVGVWLVLRLLLGTALRESGRALVPTATGPGWWAVLVVGVVAGFGVLVGVRQGSREAAVLPGAASRARRPAWWPVLLIVFAVLLLSPVSPVQVLADGLGQLLAVLLLVLGLAGSSPWLAWVAARAVAPRLSSPAALLAVRRLASDPGPAGRAAAAVGAIALTGAVIGPFVADVLLTNTGDAGYYVGPAAVVALCAVVALVVVCGTLAVHSTETVLQRRRQMAALVATGVPASVIGESQRVEAVVATVPLAVVGSVVGGLGYAGLGGGPLWAALVSIVLTVLAVVAAASLTAALMQPWVADAVRPVHLRTE